MRYSEEGIATPADLGVLARVLDEYCARHGVAGGQAREDVAFSIVQLFRDGVIDPADLSDGINSVPRQVKLRV